MRSSPISRRRWTLTPPKWVMMIGSVPRNSNVSPTRSPRSSANIGKELKYLKKNNSSKRHIHLFGRATFTASNENEIRTRITISVLFPRHRPYFTPRMRREWGQKTFNLTSRGSQQRAFRYVDTPKTRVTESVGVRNLYFVVLYLYDPNELRHLYRHINREHPRRSDNESQFSVKLRWREWRT